jgi:hypothetical protein
MENRFDKKYFVKGQHYDRVYAEDIVDFENSYFDLELALRDAKYYAENFIHLDIVLLFNDTVIWESRR